MRPLLFPNDLLYFLYLVFFKPITLDRYLCQIDTTLESNPSLWELWQRRKTHPAFLPVLQLVSVHIFFTPLLAFPLAGLLVLIGVSVNWFLLLWGVVGGIAGGVVFSVVFNVAGGVVGDVVGGVAGGIALGVAGGMTSGIVFGVIGAGALGVALGVAFGVAFGMEFGLLGGEVYGVAFGLVGSLLFGVGFGGWGSLRGVGAPSDVVGVVLGIAGGIMGGYFRLPLYLIQASAVWLAVWRRMGLGKGTPVLWDEIIWLPLPGLDQLLFNHAMQNRVTGLEAIAFVGASFAQGWAARRALAQLTLYDAQNARSLAAIAEISQTLIWLPSEGRDQLKDFLAGIDVVSQHVRAALESDTLYNRQEQLRQASAAAKQLHEGLAFYQDRRFATDAGAIIREWKHILSQELALVDQQEQIPNVYVAGSPLAEQSKVFKGRRDVFRTLERELATEAEQRPALVLFGARRVGKSSALRQLPVVLGPQVVPVSVDLQSLSLTNDAAALFAGLAEAIKKGAFASRHLDLPALTRESLQDDPYSRFADWFQLVEVALSGRWMLLCLDEYEYLEKMFADGRVDERIFQLLRSLLQNNPHLTLLFSGAHTFEELQPVWSHHLINVRTLQIGHLGLDDARELVEHPIPDFPLRYTPAASQQIFTTLSGQPFLLQSVCRDLVNLLNEENRLDADVPDVERAFASALLSASAYFSDLWRGPDTNDGQRAVLTALAKAQGAPLSEETLRSLATPADLRRLVQHDVIAKSEDGYRFKVGLVQRWVENQL